METSAKGCLVFIIVAIIGCLIFWRIINRNVIGNKQFIDFKQTFRTAYVQMPDGSSRKVHIKKWNDYENSDSIQIITVDDVVYYTHLNRIVLINEKE